MKIRINTNLLLLSFLYIVNCGMIAPNQVPKHQNFQDSTTFNQITFQQAIEEKKISGKRKRLRKNIKKIVNAVDSGALLLAVGAVVVMALIVYYFFSLGFFTGVLALAAAVLLLYILFQYLD